MRVGELLDGKYEVIQMLGGGGSGIVYKLQHLKLRTFWVAKQISVNEKNEQIIKSEVNFLKTLNHQALPKIFDVIETETQIYIIMEFIEGKTLEEILSKRVALEEKKVIEYAKQICKILSYLHNISPSPIIYRDIKPSNIIISKEDQAKLIDFGIAREYKLNSVTDTVYLGTRGYAAPEQYGKGQSGTYTDIYSLGVTMHYMATGKNPCTPPFEFALPSTINNKISKELENIIIKCIQENPADRYQSAEELDKELNGLIDIEKHMDRSENITITCMRQTFCIATNIQFACELSIAIEKLTNTEVMMLDLSNYYPKGAFCLGIDKEIEKVESFKDSCILKEETTEVSTRLHYRFYKKAFSEHSIEPIEEIIKTARDHYDFVIIYIDSFCNTHLTQMVLTNSNKIIFCDTFDLVSFHLNINQILCMFNKFNMFLDKVKLVGWTKRGSPWSLDFLCKPIFGKGAVLHELDRKVLMEKEDQLKEGCSISNYVKLRNQYEVILRNLRIPIKKKTSGINFLKALKWGYTLE